MDVEIGGIEIRDPVAIVLRLKGVEVGRQPYEGIKPATWYASTIDFDEVVVETSEGRHSFQAPNGSFQVTAVSNGATGAHWMQREVREVLHGHIPVVAGLGTTPIHLADGSGISRDDAADPVLFYSTDRFTAYTSV